MNKDLISRQDAIKEVSKYVHSVDMIIGNGTLSMAGCIDTAEEILEWLPSMDSEPKWIPCSERLPEYGKTVLWCNDKGSIFTTAITYMKGTSWAVGKRHRCCQVVAWMPLPEPYRGGEKE